MGSLGRYTTNKRQQILSLWQIVDYTEKKICTLQRPSLGYLQMLAWICAYMHNCQWLFFFFHSFVFCVNKLFICYNICLHFPFKIYALNFMFIYLCTYNYVSFKLVFKAQIFTCPVWTRYQRIFLPHHQLLHLFIYVPKINQKCTFLNITMGKFETVKPSMIEIDHFQNNKVMQIKPNTYHDERKNTTITSIKKDFKAKNSTSQNWSLCRQTK